jgi:hypothetical protein
LWNEKNEFTAENAENAERKQIIKDELFV